MSVRPQTSGRVAQGRLTCRSCGKDFIVVGSPGPEMLPTTTPLVELVVCPHCKSARRMMLPMGVAPPVIRVFAAG